MLPQVDLHGVIAARLGRSLDRSCCRNKTSCVLSWWRRWRPGNCCRCLLTEVPIEIHQYLSLVPEDEELTAYCVEAQLAEKEYGIKIESLVDLLKKHHVPFLGRNAMDDEGGKMGPPVIED